MDIQNSQTLVFLPAAVVEWEIQTVRQCNELSDMVKTEKEEMNH
jgi:hypothetical protein